MSEEEKKGESRDKSEVIDIKINRNFKIEKKTDRKNNFSNDKKNPLNIEVNLERLVTKSYFFYYKNI